jgi:hypothetical protein
MPTGTARRGPYSIFVAKNSGLTTSRTGTENPDAGSDRQRQQSTRSEQYASSGNKGRDDLVRRIIEASGDPAEIELTSWAASIFCLSSKRLKIANSLLG